MKPLSKDMNPTPQELSDLARHIAEAEARFEQLEQEIAEIGEPAAHELKRRLEALRIEEAALKRNLAQALDLEKPNSDRMRKVEALMSYIQKEEASVAHEADFLHQSAPTSSEVAVRATQRLFDLCAKGLRRVLGGHHPLGESVFVNHNREQLKDLHDVEAGGSDERPDQSR